MNQFGTAAVSAANLLRTNPLMSPEDAWDQAILATQLNSTTADKICPREAFIGLAKSGLIIGYRSLMRIVIGWNGLYAIIAVTILRRSKAARLRKRGDSGILWQAVLTALGFKTIKHNSQMEVVLSLWAANLI